jgi:ubiquinone/menaquinone biosynthesis C-methylase UbiE
MNDKWRSSLPWDEAYRSGEYLRNWEYDHPSQELVATIAALRLPRGSVALDLGCGAGREAIFLAECGYSVYGVDFSPEALRIARRRSAETGVSVSWRQAPATDLPLPDGTVDFVNDRGCFHVIPDRDRGKLARELARLTKSGAHILLRGSRRAGPEGFVPVNKRILQQFFERALFSLGPVLPITMVANVGTLSANLAILTRR